MFLCGEPLAALCAPPGEDGTPSAGPHTKPEAMRLCALAVIWLECALHGNDSLRPVRVEGRQRSGAEMAPKHRWYGPAKARVNAAGRTVRCSDTAQRTGTARTQRRRADDRSRDDLLWRLGVSVSPNPAGGSGWSPVPVAAVDNDGDQLLRSGGQLAHGPRTRPPWGRPQRLSPAES